MNGLARGLAITAAVLAAVGAGDDGSVTVVQRTWVETYTAYARIEPIRSLTVSATTTGTVSGLRLVAGDAVKAGQVIARLTGAEQAAAAARARSDVDRAEAARDLARKRVAEVQATYPDLSTRQELEAAKAAASEAEATLKAAQAALVSHQHGAAVRAPSDATVLRINVADGDRVTAGTALVRLLPEDGLWAHATFYGSAAALVAPGMTGRFEPVDGGQPVPVTVRSMAASLDPDGGREVGCRPAGTADWADGERGTLRIDGHTSTWAAVPTTALILDQGRWWVMVQTPEGPHRQEVTVGPEEEGWTLVGSGVEPGQRVVVKDAYLIFHKAFSEHYRPPD